MIFKNATEELPVIDGFFNDSYLKRHDVGTNEY